ncbi:hypothetical protein QE429_000671 [Bacillus sp. SORGH_AS 510]|nr:hypothetical protein [Bacillus sp. SORGH_AS_0510]
MVKIFKLVKLFSSQKHLSSRETKGGPTNEEKVSRKFTMGSFFVCLIMVTVGINQSEGNQGGMYVQKWYKCINDDFNHN